MTRRTATAIVVGGFAVFTLVGYALWRAGPFAQPTVARLAVEPEMLPSPGRPGQGLASTNPLHRAHIEGKLETPCVVCHSEEPASAEREHRCTACHEERASTVHAGLADVAARECVSCHDFLHVERAVVGAWACDGCHVKRRGPAPERTGAAPLIRVHGAQRCDVCHAPHGDPALAPDRCGECHADQTTDHAAKELGGAAQGCLGCHGAHRPARGATKPCRDCHDRDVSSLATFTGHDDCAKCHPPHQFTRKTARACSSCHESRAPAGRRAKHHAKCIECHDQHAPARGLADVCDRCHGDARMRHVADRKAGTCRGCHPVHDGERAAVVAIARCTTCHEDARSDESFHAGAKCAGCHPPHGTALVSKPRPEFCLGCHAKRVGGARPIATGKGHNLCVKCHMKAAHKPSREPPACTGCHKPNRLDADHRTAKYRVCGSCHDTHDPTRIH